MNADFSGIIRMLELRLKRQSEALKETQDLLASAYASQKQADLAAPKGR